MTNQEIVETILEVGKTISRDNLNRYIKNHYPSIHKELMNRTSFLNKFDQPHFKNKRISIFERLYCLEHNLTDRPKCKNCGKKYVNGFIKHENRYRNWCCPSCQAADTDVLRRSTSTKFKRYGNPNYNGIEKARKTRMQKYGGWCAPDYVEKTKNTKNKRYGNPNYVNAQKMCETKLRKYGTKGFNNPEKSKATKRIRYGDENYNNPEMISKGILENKNAYHNKVIGAKRRSYNLILKRIKEYEPLFTLDEYTSNTEKRKVWKWKHLKCGRIIESPYEHCDISIPCPYCYHMGSLTSKSEVQLLTFIKSIYNGMILHRHKLNRKLVSKNREIDIILPDSHLALEFDGLYYHSNRIQKHKYIHLTKTEECECSGYRLIHVFEDEWTFKRRLVESMIKKILGKSRNVVDSSICTISHISNHKKDEFLEKYHLEGSDKSSIMYGLSLRGHLVAVGTFVKCRKGSRHDWRLSRYASSFNFEVNGGLAAIINQFSAEMHPKSIVAYSDRRWDNGQAFLDIGFEKSRVLPPQKFFVNHKKRINSKFFRKRQLKLILKDYNDTNSVENIMKSNSYNLIYDSGLIEFVLSTNEKTEG